MKQSRSRVWASQRWRCYASCFDSAALWLARREWFFSSLSGAPMAYKKIAEYGIVGRG